MTAIQKAKPHSGHDLVLHIEDQYPLNFKLPSVFVSIEWPEGVDTWPIPLEPVEEWRDAKISDVVPFLPVRCRVRDSSRDCVFLENWKFGRLIGIINNKFIVLRDTDTILTTSWDHCQVIENQSRKTPIDQAIAKLLEENEQLKKEIADLKEKNAQAGITFKYYASQNNTLVGQIERMDAKIKGLQEANVKLDQMNAELRNNLSQLTCDQPMETAPKNGVILLKMETGKLPAHKYASRVFRTDGELLGR